MFTSLSRSNSYDFTTLYSPTTVLGRAFTSVFGSVGLAPTPTKTTTSFSFSPKQNEYTESTTDTLSKTSPKSDAMDFFSEEQDLTGYFDKNNTSTTVPEFAFSSPDDDPINENALLFASDKKSSPYKISHNDKYLPLFPDECITQQPCLPDTTWMVVEQKKNNRLVTQSSPSMGVIRRASLEEEKEKENDEKEDDEMESRTITNPEDNDNEQMSVGFSSGDDVDDEDLEDSDAGNHVTLAQAGLSLFGYVPEDQLTDLQRKMLKHKPARGRRRCKQLLTMTATEIAIEKAMRLEKSRLSAQNCRMRRKDAVTDLQGKIDLLEADAARTAKLLNALQNKVERLQLENSALLAAAGGTVPFGFKGEGGMSKQPVTCRCGAETKGVPALVIVARGGKQRKRTQMTVAATALKSVPPRPLARGGNRAGTRSHATHSAA